MAAEPGQAVTILASGAKTTSASGAAVRIMDGHWMPRQVYVVLSTTAHATDAADTLDVYIDTSWDGSNWLNAIHFTQIAGNATPAAPLEVALLNGGTSSGGTSVLDPTADQSAGDVAPAHLGPFLRARWAVADSGDANTSHTFSVTAYGV